MEVATTNGRRLLLNSAIGRPSANRNRMYRGALLISKPEGMPQDSAPIAMVMLANPVVAMAWLSIIAFAPIASPPKLPMPP